MNEQERHNRNVMLRRVRSVWLQGVLEESLHGGDIIDLGFAYRPSALANSEQPSWQQSEEYDYLLPVGTSISDVFEAAGGELLILGEPGAGKTTMLLELVTHLITKAERDESRPIPAVFSLAGFRNDQPLAAWLVDELANNYEVPRKLGEIWVADGQFVPLLDGLDEVDPDLRATCATAINAFRQSHPGVSLLVTTRSQDYRALALRLNLDKAIVLQPLSSDQIDQYLAQRGQRLANLRVALQNDATLRDLAQTPLMLSMMTLAYQQVPDDLRTSVPQGESGRKLLFDTYAERMARYRSGEQFYEPASTIHWLSWLARQMTAANKPTFFLEDMQPTWLTSAQQAAFAGRMKTMTFGLLAAPAALASLAALPVFGWTGLLIVLVVGLALAGLPLLTNRFLTRARLRFDRIETVEALNWSLPWAGLGLVLGGLAGLGLGLPPTLFDGGSGMPWLILVPIAAGISQMIENGLLRSEMRLRTFPGQGVDSSARNGRLVGGLMAGSVAIVSLVAAAVYAAVTSGSMIAALPWIIWATGYLGLGSWLAFGGLASLQHRRLRSMLHEEGALPQDISQFLDYAAERNLVRKVGGGYTFVHALLLDYFSNLEQAPVAH